MYIPESAIQFAAIIFAIRFIAGEAAFEHASRRGNVLVFRPVLGLRLMFGVGITLVLFLIAKEGISKNELIWKILLLGFAVWWFIAWPGTILVDQNSIRETRWFGLRRVEIPWTDVVFAGGILKIAPPCVRRMTEPFGILNIMRIRRALSWH